MSFTFIDLFAGIGGMRLAFEAAGGRCTFTSEWDKFSQRTYAANFESDHAIAGDITQVDVAHIPAHDVLVGGFPCQPFSIAGVSKKNALGRPHGFLDKIQGTLFFDIVRILTHHRPQAFLLENVKNLRSHDGGRTFAIITETLTALGYHLAWKVINAKKYVPQNRERIFLVGFRDHARFSFDDLVLPTGKQSLDTVLHREDGTEAAEPPYTLAPHGTVNPKYTLSPKLWTYLQNYAAKHRAKGNGFGFGLVGRTDTARTLSARYFKDGSEILVKQADNRPRRLTPRECARLMGFDQPGRPPFIIPVSDTQAYRQFGNAIVVPVVADIAHLLSQHLSP